MTIIPAMKTLTISVLLLLLASSGIKAQQDSIQLQKFYHVWVIPTKGYKHTSGTLFRVGDSSILVSNSIRKKDYFRDNYYVTSFDVSTISALKVRRQGRGFAVLVGGVTGLAAGIAISAAYMDHLQNTMNPVAYVFGGFILGSLPILVSTGIGIGTGAIFAKKTVIPLEGSQVFFERNKQKLNSRALVFNPQASGGNGPLFNRLITTVEDTDGKIYALIALGGQVWMAENLKCSKYRDGTPVTGATVTRQGMLYDWHCISSNHQLCPEGWHVPSIREWQSFVNSLGGEKVAGAHAERGFTEQGKAMQWWSSTEAKETDAYSLYINNATVGTAYTVVPKTRTLSVRCIRNF